MLRILTALASEARPILDHFRLRAMRAEHPFRLYESSDIQLVVSGIGKVPAAAAAAYLQASTGGGRQHAWLNVGIAGHPSLALGEARLANKIVDFATGKVWYPPPSLVTGLERTLVTCVDRVEKNYAASSLYEMETAGFYPTVCRFSTAELVQCLKIVSDGPEQAPESLNAAAVDALVRAQLPAIQEVAEQLLFLSAEARRAEEPPADHSRLVQAHRFTRSEERILRLLLERRGALAPDAPLPAELTGITRGSEINKILENWLNSLPMALRGGGKPA